MFSKRGQLVLLVGVFFLAGGFSTASYMLLALGCLLIFASIVSLPFFKLTTFIENLTIERHIDRKKVFAKDLLYVHLKVKNNTGRRIGLIEITDIIPESFKVVYGSNIVKTHIPSHSEIEFGYIVQPRIRGKYEIGPTKTVIHDRFKFNLEELTFDNYSEIVVYPTYEDVRRMESLANKRALGMLFGVHRTKDRGIGTDFFGIRQYVPSDELRWVDWKASARTGKLMTREYESERNIKVIILVDASNSMRGGGLEDSKLEYAIRAAVLLSYVGLERRDEMGLAAFSDNIVKYVPPKSGRSQMYRILEALAEIKPSGTSRLDNAVRFITAQIHRSALLIILTDLESRIREIIEGVKLARASNFDVLVISPFTPWFEANTLALSPLEKALSEAVAEEFYENRMKIAKELKRMDVDVINVGPDDFLPAVVTQYLKAKKRGAAIT